jgi:putative FmdB family regulatory protein
MPRYDFQCRECGAVIEAELPVEQASVDLVCPVCGQPAKRLYTMPKLLFKADPRDVTAVWHQHDGYAHAHAPRRGRHRNPSEDH